MRFAYLILAHNNFRVLDKLVGMLDDSRNDIFIHYDRKVKALPAIRTEHSELHIISDRVDVRWGTVSQIEALFKLYNAAYAKVGYDFYFVISGAHLPLKDQEYIHSYFSRYQGNTVIRKWPEDEGEADFKMRRYHMFIDNFQSRNKIRKALVQKVWSASMFIQKHLGIRKYRGLPFIKADEWAVICASHIKYLLDHEYEILKKYRHTFCCDEFYLASELTAYDKLHVTDDQNILYVQFDNESPYELDLNDYSRLIESPYIFARKFSDKSI